MPDHEVVIIGAGPVGLMLACLLAQEGVDVAVWEGRGGADERVRAIGIHPPGIEALDAVDLGHTARAAALALEGGDVFSGGRRLASLDFEEDRCVYVLPQPVTTGLLSERLDQLAPESLRRGRTVGVVHQQEELVRLSVHHDDGGQRDLTASLLVAADGVRSNIRTQIGSDWRPHPGRATYAMVDVRDPCTDARAGLFCEPGGLVESFPLPGEWRRWVVRQSERAAASTLNSTTLRSSTLRRQIEERTGILPDIADDSLPVVFRAAQHLARPISRGRIVLLGDAAHEVSPIGGQGMNLGWLDAQRLAAVILRDRSRGTPDFSGYERQVRRSTRAAQRRSAFYMSMGSQGNAVSMSARAGLIRALGSPPLRRWTAGLITMQSR